MSLWPVLLWNNTKELNTGGPELLSSVSVGDACTSGTNNCKSVCNGNYTGTNYIKANIDYCNSASTKPSICNGVVNNYAPYTYPHPLRVEVVPPDTTPPASPAGVAVI